MGVSNDEVSQAVLLIKSSSARTSSLETFLRNRDWYVFSSSSLKEALSFLVEHKPLFVMIPVDHPVRKIRVLPKILIQAFPVCVINYVEQPTAPSYNLLVEAPGPYKIKYPATGPGVLRTIQRYFQDQEKIEQDAAAASADNEQLNSSSGERHRLTPGPETDPDFGEGPHGLTPGGVATPRKLRGLKGLSKHGSWEPIDPKLLSEDDENNPESVEIEIPEIDPKSIFEAGAQTALDESAQIGDGNIKELVKVATNVACITVESNRFSGYLVAAMGQNRKMDDSFVESIREKLTKFLIQQGDIVTKDDQMNLTIKPVDFQAWALDYAEFLRKSVHNGDEVAMAFFPKKIEKTEVGESASSEMATISLDDVVVGVPLEFNLYIYMPVNQKYILYTPKGAKLYQEQKQRLTTQGHKSMHMLKAEVPEIDRFKAQNHLNDIIDQHHTKAKKPA